MKQIIHILILVLTMNNIGKAQVSTAMDFTMSDCNGKMHHLFEELDKNDVVLIEFMMLNCVSCVTAAQKIYPMYNNIHAQYPGRIKYYLFGFQDIQPTYSCANIANWASVNGFPNMLPFDSGAVQVAYYGGMGMPTVTVLAGTQHQVLFNNPYGFVTTDTTDMGKAIRDFLKTNAAIGIQEEKAFVKNIQLIPNPTKERLQLNFYLNEKSVVNLSLLNTLGQKVQSVQIAELNEGEQIYSFNLSGLESGLYSVIIQTNKQQYSEKVLITK